MFIAGVPGTSGRRAVPYLVGEFSGRSDLEVPVANLKYR